MDFKKLKKYLIPSLAVFVVITLFNLIFHEIIMEKMYLNNSHLFRPQDEICRHKHFMWIANLIYSFAFCYIYSKGHEKTDLISQGLRYGLWISLLIWVPHILINFTVYPHPKMLELSWLCGYVVQTLIAGVTAAFTFSKGK